MQVKNGAKLEDLEAAGKEKRGYIAEVSVHLYRIQKNFRSAKKASKTSRNLQVKESLTADELTALLKTRVVADSCKEVFSDCIFRVTFILFLA